MKGTYLQDLKAKSFECLPDLLIHDYKIPVSLFNQDPKCSIQLQ